MTRSHVGIEASDSEVRGMLNILEATGKILQPVDIATCVTSLPDDVRQNKERITRFLLLVALLDQQAVSPTARSTAGHIYDKFGDNLFFSPQAVLVRMHTLVDLKDDYKISPAIGRGCLPTGCLATFFPTHPPLKVSLATLRGFGGIAPKANSRVGGWEERVNKQSHWESLATVWLDGAEAGRLFDIRDDA